MLENLELFCICGQSGLLWQLVDVWQLINGWWFVFVCRAAPIGDDNYLHLGSRVSLDSSLLRRCMATNP